MVKRTKKEFKDYNDFHDREFGLKWGTAYALDDLMKGVRANEAYALKTNDARPQMTREQIDTVLSDSFLSNKEIIVQLNLLDEFGRLRDDLSGFFKGEAYQDYFVLNDLPVYWEDVRHVAFKETTKWFEADPFKETKAPNVPNQADSLPTLEKDDFYQPFYEEEGANDGRNDLDKDV
jgi:hypothetical protein